MLAAKLHEEQGLKGKHRPSRCLLAVPAVVCLLAQMTGCVTSEQSRYLRHLNAVVSQGPAANDDVAVAFALDGHADDDESELASAAADNR